MEVGKKEKSCVLNTETLNRWISFLISYVFNFLKKNYSVNQSISLLFCVTDRSRWEKEHKQLNLNQKTATADVNWMGHSNFFSV